MSFEKLTIITITYSDSADLSHTYSSIKQVLRGGAKWILISHERLETFESRYLTKKIEGKDSGLYDALNLGLTEVSTEYFMLLHSGDTIFDYEAFTRATNYTQDGYDLILGGSMIGDRLHKSRYWKKWMFRFYVQPPHLPIIYKTECCIKERYNVEISTVADFYYLRELFQRQRVIYKHSGEVYIRMLQGGLTTSGLRSFIHVTTSFMKVDGFMPLLISPFRLLLKILLR